MADAVQNAEWDRTAHLMSAISASGWNGKWIDPNKLNPYYREPPKTKAQEQSESRRAFKLLGQALKEMAG